MSIESFYKKLWSAIGGRPWTLILRDIYHKYEIVPQLVWCWFGIGSACIVFKFNLPIWILAVAWGVYLFGYLNGHLHWGSD